MAIDDLHFQVMLKRAREFRRRIDELGSVSGPVIDANVRARLRWNPQPPQLPPGQRQLADEILDLLKNPQLSTGQARELAQAFRGA